MGMRRPKRLAKVIGLLGCFAVGLLTAGFVGYAIGGASSSSALKALRNGQTEQGIALLETTFDGSVLEYWGYLQWGDSVFDRSREASKSHRAMQQVAAYREAFPTSAKNDHVRTTIRNTLDYVRSHPDGKRREDEATAQGASGR